MKSLLKWGILSVFSVSMMMGTTACSDDDPNYNDVTPPEVEAVASTIGGIVSEKSGNVVTGAQVTLTDSKAGTQSTQTDTDGVYLFEDVQPGTYTVTVEANGKVSETSTITVEESEYMQRYIWNISLASDERAQVAVSATETTSTNFSTETLKGNEVATVDVTATVPANAVAGVEEGQEVVIGIKPVYSIAGAERSTNVLSRATAETLLTGSELSCNVEGATLDKAIELRMDVGEELVSGAEVRKYKDGKWTTVDWTADGTDIVVEAEEFATYGVFINISYTLKDSQQAVTFEQSVWDNLYGSKEMNIASATYSFKGGTEVTTTATDKLTGLLVEKLTQLYSSASTTVTREYPLNVTLPIGTKLEISGSQTITNATITGLGKSASITNYGDVTIKVTTSNREHTGSSN